MENTKKATWTHAEAEGNTLAEQRKTTRNSQNPRIGIVGNMNNNGFAIMRYFRDLGADAHLLLYDNDGKGSLSHFAPENDSWEIDKWTPFIHRTDMINGYPALLGYPHKLQPPISKRKLKSYFKGYDQIIGSGVAPTILGRIGRKLDIFFPYGVGIEFVGLQVDREMLDHGALIRKYLTQYLKYHQIRGIKQAKFCLNAEMSLTRTTFDEIGVEFLPLAIPMVYKEKASAYSNSSQSLKSILERFEAHDCVVMGHASLTWVWDKTVSKRRWKYVSKNNDWLIRGFAEFLESKPAGTQLLAIVEYGPDVEATKSLCKELGISHQVIWLPKMSRKELMILLAHCDIGVGEFYLDKGVMWGGTGWEVLASGKPLLQGFQFEEEEYQAIYGHCPPPMLPVKSQNDILKHLVEMHQNPEKRTAIGQEAAKWFNRYNGISLAEKWLNLLIRPVEERGIAKKA